ncbi:Prenylcysteine oxidase [Cyphomyrmex costatus]|uniref:Prenylcysteine oxidase n=1 Tax=Cyphomyrmex costatus TaxID=456900 RepID=A0A195BZR4_9HYME|nr:Prenylcysteine oxidase [Cyphomyrmex costatus]
MGLHIGSLILGVIILQQGISLKVHSPHVAIIGGGIGGAVTSHFLTELFNESVKIDLYEPKTIGGRLATIKIDEDEIEAGGSIIHSKNMYMQRFVKLLGLEKNPSSAGTFGIWNGDEFIFKASDWSAVSLMKLFYRYGFQLYNLKRERERREKVVPEHLIYRNKKVNVVPSRVTKIRNLVNDYDSSQYEVTYINKGSTDPMTSNYDIVIIAAPLTSDQEFQIEFAEFPDNLVFPGKYQTTYATFIKADLKPKYFGLQEPLDGILSCNPNKTTISSVGKVGPVDGSIRKDPQVWKVFSRKPLESSLIHDMFSKVIEKKEIAWKAYPRYSTKMNFNNFKLHDALYYVNAIEWAGSTMEMSAIAGRNVAILTYNDFIQKFPNSILTSKDSKDTFKKLCSEDL